MEVALASLIQPADQTNKKTPHESTCRALAALAPRLEPVQAKRALSYLLQLATNDGDNATFDKSASIKALTFMVGCLQTRQVEPVLQLLIKISKKTESVLVLEEASKMMTLLAPRLSPTQAELAWASVIMIARKTNELDEHIFEATKNGLTALDLRLETAEVDRALVFLEESLRETDDWDTLQPAFEGLRILATRLEPEQANRAWESLTELISKTEHSRVLEDASDILVVLAKLVSREQVEHVFGLVFARQLEWRSNGKSVIKLASNVQFLKHIQQLETIVELLRHPGTVGHLKNGLVNRAEEIALHNGQPLYSDIYLARIRAAEMKETGRWTEVDEANLAARRNAIPKRRFMTIQDAAVWIEKHYPGIDLEKPNCIPAISEH